MTLGGWCSEHCHASDWSNASMSRATRRFVVGPLALALRDRNPEPPPCSPVRTTPPILACCSVVIDRHARATVPLHIAPESVMSDFTALETPTTAALDAFVATLESVRASSTPEEWRARVTKERCLRHWRYFLAQDPYTRWGMMKPRGYPGDASLMDFAYQHPSIAAHVEHAGVVGKEIFDYTVAAPQSASARARLHLITTLIEERVAAGQPVSVLSCASGHAREIENLSASAKAKLQHFCAVDLDPISLAEAARAVAPAPFRAVRRNVIKDDLSDLAPASLVYSLGLFDYLTHDAAQQVLRMMWARTAPGGTCLIANLASDAANLAYCEAIMDWWMITRTESDMRALANTLETAGAEVAAYNVARNGCFFFLTLTKH